MRLRVRVTPGSSRTAVGGRYDDGSGSPALVVRVSARPVEGKANAAVVQAVARAFAVRPRQVSVAAGHQSRTKHLEIDGDAAELQQRLTELLDA